jgi:pyruvate dehydrogenase E1 component
MVTRILEEGRGRPFVAVSDWMRATPFQIADFVPGPFAALGTDGFGRSDTREALRRLHRIDAHAGRLLRARRAREARGKGSVGPG